MSEYEYDQYEDDDYQPETESKNPVRARMKELEKRLADAEKRAASAETAARKAAFLEAGLDPGNKMTQYFMKAYDGDMTPESIKQAAMEANLIHTPEQDTSEADAWKRTEKVAQGAGTASAPIDWNKRIAEASSEEEVLAILAEARNAI